MGKDDRKRVHYGWAVLAMGAFCVFGALGLARFGYAMVLPNMQAGLGMDNGQAGLLATISLTGYLVMATLGGALASRYGVRIVTALALLAAGFGMLFTGLSQSFISAVLWNGLVGAGSGAANIAIMGLWPAWFSKKRRGLAAGIAVSGISVGLIFTGLIVPKIVAAYQSSGWKVSWIVFGVITLFIGAASYGILRNNPAQIGLKPIGDNGQESEEGRQKPKGSIKDICLSAPVWYLGLVYFAFGFSYIIFMTFFIKHLIVTASFNEASAGNMYMLMGWLSMFSGLLWGAISDSIGRKTTLTILYAIQAIAFLLFGLGGSIVFFILPVLLFGITAWSIPAIMSSTCGDIFGPRLAPTTLGFITLFFGLGQVLGPAVAGFMADKTGSFDAAFLVAAAVSFFGALTALLLIKSPASSTVAPNTVIVEKN